MTFAFGNGIATDGQEPNDRGLTHEADAADVLLKQGNGWRSRSMTPVPNCGDASPASPYISFDFFNGDDDGETWTDSDTLREMYSSMGVPR